jgi:hypothetical protein
VHVRQVVPRDALPSIDGPTFGQQYVGADDTTWDPVTGESADSRRLDRLPTRRLFAFAWQDDHGPDTFWSAGDG